MKIRQYEVWIADLNPRFGTETGKTRPVIVIQTNLLNNLHPSTLICPLTTNIQTKSDLLRIHLHKGTADVKQNWDIMVDQLRVIDNRRLQKRIGNIPKDKIEVLKENLKLILDLSD